MYPEAPEPRPPSPVTPGASRPCWFCRPPGTEAVLVWEDDLFRLVHPVEADGPTALGSVQLQTRRHARDLGDLTDEEAEHLGPLLRRISRCLTEVSHAEWCYCYLFLEGYRHVHFVLSARFPGLPPEHLRLNAHTWSGAPHGSRADVIALGRSLGEALHAATGSR